MSDEPSAEFGTIKRSGFMVAGAASVAAMAAATQGAAAQVSSGCEIDTQGHIDIAPIDPAYFTPNRFAGKVLLITGCATGIGAASAVRAAREGAAIVGIDVKREQLHATIDAISGEGHKAVAVDGNVADDEACEEMVRTAVARFGRLDCALNAAGVIDGGDPAIPLTKQYLDAHRDLFPNPIHRASNAYWEAVLSNNLTGMFKSLRAELRQLVVQESGGSIVNIGSIAGLTGLASNSAYVASKHGVEGLTASAAVDYAPYGIRVNSVNMAATKTPMTERAGEFVKLSGATPNPFSMGKIKTLSILAYADTGHRMATPWEQAAPILFLLSPEASNLTGGLFATDGGWTAY
jgi:NAD(P)-dependent dehydrogenase (short-subunit alcohol dehydrogenase family)